MTMSYIDNDLKTSIYYSKLKNQYPKWNTPNNLPTAAARHNVAPPPNPNTSQNEVSFYTSYNQGQNPNTTQCTDNDRRTLPTY